MVLLSCSSNAPVINKIDLTLTPNTNIPAISLNNTTAPTVSKTKINLSPELYLDETSSPDNLQGEIYNGDYDHFSNQNGNGLIYRFGNEEWVTSLTWTRTLPLSGFYETSQPNEELRQHYIQVWRSENLLYSFPVNDIGYEQKNLLRYGDHWIFWFTDLDTNLGWVVQDGVTLNNIHNYESAFSVFLLDDKPFFFFQRDNQFGVSFNNQEILLPYSNISYAPICCEGGGSGRWNPRGTNIMVGFYTKENSEYRYIEIGLR